MSSRTRYFLIGSALTVAVGLGTGLVAYYTGTSARGSAARLPELVYLPADASAVAYADVRDIMASEFRQRLREMLPTGAEKDRLLADTGIDIERDIDSVVAGLGHGATGANGALVIFRGRFDPALIEKHSADHGGVAEDYKGKRLLLSPQHDLAAGNSQPGIAFLESDLLALGGRAELQAAIDAAAGGANVTSNALFMDQLPGLQTSGNAWVVGQVDALAGQASMPAQIRDQLPSLEWFSVSADIDRGVRGVLRAEARDEQAGEQLRSVINGGLSAARLLTGQNTPIATALSSLQLAGNGRSIEITFALGPEVLDMLKTAVPQAAAPPLPSK
jgi:hypothetical protein